MGFNFHKIAVLTMVVMTLVLFSVIYATVTDENIKQDDTNIDSAKSTKDKITGTGEYVADKASMGAESAKDTSYESAKMAKNGVEYVMDAAHEASKDSVGYVQDSAYKTAESAKGGAEYVKDKANDGAGYVKDATYGKTQLGAKKEGAAEKGKEGGDEDTLEWAKEKAKQGYEKAKNVILGSGSYNEEL
uniref:late embryogenesis abundant protein D-29-like n=1 Tax=Erigeron canadensis TaxID=72917 RepID=UPI001CB88D5F|nr:late embryogenesis abundant protein D-29-like [Erigeron canadensis]